MLDLHTRGFGYTEISPPLLVRDEVAVRHRAAAEAAEEMFRTTRETGGFWLIRPPRCR
jgi:seryl-tRNA synthetase